MYASKHRIEASIFDACLQASVGLQRTVDGHGDAAALAHHVRAPRQLGQVTLPSCEVLGAHGGADRAAEVVQDDRHACKAAAPKLVNAETKFGSQG